MQFLNQHTSKYQKRSKHFVCTRRPGMPPVPLDLPVVGWAGAFKCKCKCQRRIKYKCKCKFAAVESNASANANAHQLKQMQIHLDQMQMHLDQIQMHLDQMQMLFYNYVFCLHKLYFADLFNYYYQ